MQGVSCLYRRPSGIYAVRLVVPTRLRELVGRREIHTSTGLRDWGAAKLAALKIQLHWRERFMVLNIEKLSAQSPLLLGEGVVPIVEAARAIGLAPGALLTEMLNARVAVYAHVQHWAGWQVPNLDVVERDYDGTFVTSDVEARGVWISHSGFVRAFDSVGAVAGLISEGKFMTSLVLLSDGAALFLPDEREIGLAACTTPKSAVETIRARLAGSLPAAPLKPASEPIDALAPTAPTVSTSPLVIVHDPISAKHGAKRFSELFAFMRKHRAWGEDQARRMATESGLFVELMDDPKLDDIDVEMVQEFAARLSRAPTDIYLAQRRYKIESLQELIAIADAHELPRKSQKTVIGHIGRLCEIFNFAVKKGMMRINPASGYQREWSVGKKTRDQDERQLFTPAELAAIFGQDWFRTGSGEFYNSGRTNWRPHQYWLPLLGLLTGGRLNELSQLYLDDVVQAEASPCVWYADFNLDQPDKMAVDADDVASDKSLKTVNAIRVVPLHPELIRLGLPQYVDALRRAGHVRLFPELKRDKVKGYGKPVGSWFNERFLGRKLDMERNGMKTFHSLRHNFLTAIERLDLSERVMAQLAGHERGRTQSGRRYAKDRTAAELASDVSRLRFDCLSDVSPFSIDNGLRAIDYALRLKSKGT